MKLILDTSVLVRLCHPTDYGEVKDWLRSLLLQGARAPELLIPVLADYELRKNLVRRGANASLAHLDSLARAMTYVPVTSEAVRRAAEISAGLGAEERRLSDVDVLLMAQAQIEGAILVTSDQQLQKVAATAGLAAKGWAEIQIEDRDD